MWVFHLSRNCRWLVFQRQRYIELLLQLILFRILILPILVSMHEPWILHTWKLALHTNSHPTKLSIKIPFIQNISYKHPHYITKDSITHRFFSSKSCYINRKSVITIQIWLDLTRFRKYFSMYIFYTTKNSIIHFVNFEEFATQRLMPLGLMGASFEGPSIGAK